jgi:hypothetical protein
LPKLAPKPAGSHNFCPWRRSGSRAPFYGGGFGVEHGRKGASVLDLSLREGNMVSPTVTRSYDLLRLELNYDGPASPLGSTSLLVNYRTFDMINAQEIAGEKGFGDPVMSDLVVKTTTHLNAANTISVPATQPCRPFRLRDERPLVRVGQVQVRGRACERPHHRPRNVLGDEDRMRYSREVVARNADRVPDFHLLNVRVDYRRRLGPVALVTFLDLENIYNRFHTCEERFSPLTGKERAIGFRFLGNAGFKLEL